MTGSGWYRRGGKQSLAKIEKTFLASNFWTKTGRGLRFRFVTGLWVCSTTLLLLPKLSDDRKWVISAIWVLSILPDKLTKAFLASNFWTKRGRGLKPSSALGFVGMLYNFVSLTQSLRWPEVGHIGEKPFSRQFLAINLHMKRAFFQIFVAASVFKIGTWNFVHR